MQRSILTFNPAPNSSHTSVSGRFDRTKGVLTWDCAVAEKEDMPN